jgi:hypothetical protein
VVVTAERLLLKITKTKRTVSSVFCALTLSRKQYEADLDEIVAMHNVLNDKHKVRLCLPDPNDGGVEYAL